MYDITPETLAQTQRFSADIWSDLHKDAHGFRPRFSLAGYSPQELDALWDRTVQEMRESIDCEIRENAAALEALKARINKMVADFSITRQDAFRWLLQAEEAEEDYDWYGMSYFLHCQGISGQGSFDCETQFKEFITH